MNTILGIALGGALGAVLRYGAGVAGFKMLGEGFPYATLFVNVIGSCLMGFFIALFAHFVQPSHELRAFIITGFLGGFTTFSTFSLEVVTLYERGALGMMALYILLSLTLSIASLFGAMFFMRSLVS